jgi:hypothetical protein
MKKTVQGVLLTKLAVESEIAVWAKGGTYETDHAGKQQARICWNRLHGPADRTEVA